jgi:hypothetical protein
MNDHDLMDAVRSTRRVSDAEISAVTDRHALNALREGITMTDRNQLSTVEAPRRGRRLGRRGMAAGALGVLLIGSGAAYAGYQQWYVGGGADGITCMMTWQDPAGEQGTATSGGPALTADPVADCQRYQALSGKPPIKDPVAFAHNGRVFVAPRQELPADGRVQAAPSLEDARSMELDAGLEDWVDGGNSRCFSRSSAQAFMDSELKRLGLSDWTTKIMPDNRPFEEGPCGFFDTDPSTRTAMFFPDRGGDPNVRKPDAQVAGFVYDVRDALRAGITDTCVSVTAAEAVAEKATGSEHHWPTTAVVDPGARCASVDMVVGGSIQITVRGPETARP